MSTVRVFEYVDRLDAFVVTDEYRRLAEQLGLEEWNPVVWIGRLFMLDNDYGEHWFHEPTAKPRGIAAREAGSA